ncbi:hypothetical protein V5799_012020 [Amblyomma americanum]|uniref:Uncharacterized protein n=1 Tax=Amblyomma americanum TaxID=6943 RepID=A0AAQ4EFP6_AMBAM
MERNFSGRGKRTQRHGGLPQCFSQIVQHAATPHVHLSVGVGWLPLDGLSQPLRHDYNVPLAITNGCRGALLLQAVHKFFLVFYGATEASWQTCGGRTVSRVCGKTKESSRSLGQRQVSKFFLVFSDSTETGWRKCSTCIIKGADGEADDSCSIMKHLLEQAYDFFSASDGLKRKGRERTTRTNTETFRETEDCRNVLDEFFQQDGEIFRIFHCDEDRCAECTKGFKGTVCCKVSEDMNCGAAKKRHHQVVAHAMMTAPTELHPSQ